MKPQKSFRNSSIRVKLLLLMALNSSLALLLAGAGFLGYEALQYRIGATRELTTLADIVGASSTAALTFADERAANETLTSLCELCEYTRTHDRRSGFPWSGGRVFRERRFNDISRCHAPERAHRHDLFAVGHE